MATFQYPEIEKIIGFIGTSKDDKNLIWHETDHFPPRVEYIKETSAWLDKYLGLVK